MWAEWDTLKAEAQHNRKIHYRICFALGFDTISFTLQNLWTGSDIVQDLNRQIDVIEKFEDTQLLCDFVDEYVKMENGKYTKRQLQGDMMIMLNTPIDTTYSALTFALLEAARDPKLQQELHDEVAKAFGDDFESIKLKGGISKIPKLRAFIQLRCSFCAQCQSS